jgi:predicted ATPase/class 3 adenylate cyclase/tetratricopeptide (TPR) repeat protein
MPEQCHANPVPPPGTVTFLFTDIEGSTTLWESHPGPMQAALARHDALLQQTVRAHDGHIVKSTGDGIHAVFAAAVDAFAAGLAIQRALQHPETAIVGAATATSASVLPSALKVRMGLHTGSAELRDGDYYGAAVNRAARIMSVAHGEQLLLSATTGELIRDRLPQGVALREMGEHRLKGLLNPEHLLQVVAPGMRTAFPPLASFNGHSLPAESDLFVGRRDALAELARRFDTGDRLVSILGIGGTGKTRLATRFAWGSFGCFPGGAWFCDLSQARTLDGIVQSVAQGLDLPLGKDDPVTQLGHAIAGRGQCLLILDNFEQVARHAEETLGRWLNRAGQARFLVTTREVLGLRGEAVLALAPLPLAEGTELFVRRAGAAKPGFEPSADDGAAIDPLVKLLEGLPLAIELAAARVRVMSPRILLARMRERFKLLASTGGRVDRQATLRAVFDWSWDLLSSPEKAALAQLSVFEGGFTLESLETILDLSAFDDPPWVMDVLQSLVDKSFVRRVTEDRFDLLVSVQEYAAEHLSTPGRYPGSGPAALHAAEVRHGAYFSGLSERAVVADGGADLDNCVVACRRAAARGDVDAGVDALERAWAGVKLRGPFRLGDELVCVVRAMPGLNGAAVARVDWVAGRVLWACGRNDAAGVRYEAALTGARAAGDERCACRALIGLGILDSHAGRMEAARARLDTALALACALDDRTLQCDARSGLGSLEEFLGHPGPARSHYERALALARTAQDRHREGDILGDLGTLYGNAGEMVEAQLHHQAALVAAREVGNRRLEGNTLCNFGLLQHVQGDSGEALGHLDAALVVARDLGHARLEGIVLCNLGLVHDSLTRFEEAQDCFSAALVVARELDDRRMEGQIRGYLGPLFARRGRYDDARCHLDAGEALLRAASDQMSLGILLCGRAETEELAGNEDAARAALDGAASLTTATGAGPESELGLALARTTRLLGEATGVGEEPVAERHAHPSGTEFASPSSQGR